MPLSLQSPGQPRPAHPHEWARRDSAENTPTPAREPTPKTMSLVDSYNYLRESSRIVTTIYH